MAKRAVRRTESVIDPMFLIPEGVDELYYEEEAPDDIEEAAGSDDGSFIFGEGYGEGDDTTYDDSPSTPSILGIIPPQVIRMTDAGDEVVDVVFDVEDIAGATNYEFRVTKL